MHFAGISQSDDREINENWWISKSGCHGIEGRSQNSCAQKLTKIDVICEMSGMPAQYSSVSNV